MNCEACRTLLGEYIDGDLPDAEREEVQQHIRRCNACRQAIDFLERLCRDAADLPKDIPPGKDLWAGIEAGIGARPRLKSPQRANGSRDIEYERERRRTPAWWWPIAAAVMIGLLVLAGTYLTSTKQPGKDLNTGEPSNSAGIDVRTISGSTSSRPPDIRRNTDAGRAPGVIENRFVREFTSGPLEPFSRVFVSNYGICITRQDLDSSSLAVNLNFILDFDQNGMEPWIPPLPQGSMLLAVYPGEGKRLWVSYEMQTPRFQSVVAELDFGADSQIRNVLKSYDLHIGRFVVGPTTLIYAAGFRNDYGKTVSELTRGQSIVSELLHIIDAQTGAMLDLLPVTLYSRDESQAWSGQTAQYMSSLAENTIIAVKSNGNFFVTTDLASALPSIRGLIKNEAIEYSPTGTATRKWDLGGLEPDAYLNKIFVDVDDSILAEIVRHPDMSGSQSLDRTMMDRYLLRVDPGGRITAYQPALYPDESILGWMGQTRELVTVINEEGIQQISIHRLSPANLSRQNQE